MRRIFYGLIFVVGCLGVWYWLAYSKESISRPHVILITIDTLRRDSMGAYGYKKNTTPNIDEWAKKATIFQNFYTPVPLTVPSFASLFLGRHPFTTRVISNDLNHALSNNSRTLAWLLQDAKYQTAAFVTNQVLKQSGLDNGFETYKEMSLSDIETENFFPTMNAIRWMSTHKDKPMFLWVHYTDPHAPYQPPQEFQCSFDPKYCATIRMNGVEKLEDTRKAHSECQNQAPSNEEVEVFKTLYDGEIAFADQQIGIILDAINSEGIDNNSIVVIASDHGEGFDHNFYYSHFGVSYNSHTQIPFLIRLPNQKNMRLYDKISETTDFVPSMLDLLGISRKNYIFDGKSFADSIRMDTVSQLKSFFLIPQERVLYGVNAPQTKYSILTGKYKYIMTLNDYCVYNGQTEELYDMEQDPNELRNLNFENQEMKRLLKKQMLNFISQYNYPLDYIPPEEYQDSLEILKTLGY